MTAGTCDMFGDPAPPEFRSGAAPGRPGQVIRRHAQTGQRHLDWLTWGHLPGATGNPAAAPRPIHARAETVAELPLFAGAFRHRRAIVPASQYYQRRTIGEPRGERCAIMRHDGRPLAIAGLWENQFHSGIHISQASPKGDPHIACIGDSRR